MGKDEREKMSNLKATNVPELNEGHAQLFAQLIMRKEYGKDYEPDLLNVMQAALDRHLRSKIIPSTELLSSRKVLQGKERKLRQLGMGNGRTKPKA